MLVASSTQTAVGWVIAVLVGIGFIVYVIANLRAAKPEVGSEIELAANRKPYFADDVLETSRLDRSLLFALAMLAITAVALPVYWLAEPARLTSSSRSTAALVSPRPSKLQCETGYDAARECPLLGVALTSADVEGFGCWPLPMRAGWLEGRRLKAFRGESRG